MSKTTSTEIRHAMVEAGIDSQLITVTYDDEIMAPALLIYRDEQDPRNPGWAYRIPRTYDADVDMWGEHDSGCVDDLDDVRALAHRAIALASYQRKGDKMAQSKVMRTWNCTDGNADVEYVAATAKEAAQAYVDDGDWGDDQHTMWVHINCTPLDDDGEELSDEMETITVAIDPSDPKCTEDDHDWQSPIEVVGGCRENPGVFAHGGGVFIYAVCSHCGLRKTTDTWAQDPATGEQGLRSVAYDYDVKYEVLDHYAGYVEDEDEDEEE